MTDRDAHRDLLPISEEAAAAPQRIDGIGASAGVGIGAAHLVDRRRLRVPRYQLPAEQRSAERQRLLEGIERTHQQLERTKQRLAAVNGDTLIIEAHQLMLRDRHMIDPALELIAQRGANAEWALDRSVAEIKRVFDEVDNAYLSERGSDLVMVARQLISTLLDDRRPNDEIPADSVVVAHDVSPAEIVRFHRAGVCAVVAETGGASSHTAIIARSIGIPLILGARGALQAIAAGDTLAVNGETGQLFIEPSEERVDRLVASVSRSLISIGENDSLGVATTVDGRQVELMVNVATPSDAIAARRIGAAGVGLVRTEFLYLERESPPTEDEHYAFAVELLEELGELPVTIRTCDLGVQSMFPDTSPREEPNPALGLRSSRLMIAHPELYWAQLRGLLRASAVRPFRLLLPQIAGVSEVRAARRIVEAIVDKLRLAGRPVGRIELGVMIEVPAAALLADQIAEEVDFFSVGTNDLTQYTLAVDRMSDRVVHLHQPCHPAVLRMLKMVAVAATECEIDLAVCGEMASDLQSLPVLVGLGVTQLSMNAASLPLVNRTIRALDASAASALLPELVAARTTEEVIDRLRAAESMLYADRLRTAALASELI